MGYFNFGAINFIYKIYRSKRFRKFLIGFGFLAFVLFTIFNNTTFASETDWGANCSAILIQQIKYNNDMISLFDGCIHTLESGNGTVVNNGGTAYTLDSFQQLFKSYFANNPAFRDGWFYYDSSTNGLWFQSIGSSTTINSTVGSVSDTNGTSSTYNVYGTQWYQATSNAWCFYIKITSTGYQCDFTFNTAHSFFIPSDILSEGNFNASGVNIMKQSGVGLIAHVWDYFMSGNVLNDNIGVINTNQEINESVTETNDFLNQDSDTGVVDDITNTLVDDTTDITQEGFNSIFTQIKNTFTSSNTGNPRITFPIPFTNQSIELSRNTLFGGKYWDLYNGTLGVTIRNFWLFLVGLYIYKDIAKTIHKVQSGNIEEIENSNIKEDLL